MMGKSKPLQWLLLFALALSTTTMDAQQDTTKHEALTAEQQSIVGISAHTATGDLESLKVTLNSGLDAGLTVNEVKEVLVQLYAYCGFPRSLNGINTLMAVLEERKAKGQQDITGQEASPVHDSNKYQTGKNTLQKLTGKEEKTLAGANAFAPAIDTFLKEHLFADIFSRDILTYQERELVTVAALAAMTGTQPQLQAHIGMAMNTGLTEQQFLEAFIIIDQLINKKQGDLARSTLEKVIAMKKQ